MSAPLTLPTLMLSELEAAYATPPRAYHNFGHVQEVLHRFAEVTAGPGWAQPAEVYLAALVEADWSRVYSLKQFTAAARVQTPGSTTTSSGPQVNISGNLPTIDLDDLPSKVTARTKALIVNGDDPDDPTRWGSRSEATWHVMCELVEDAFCGQ